MAAVYSPMLHNGGRSLTYDANGPLPPGHPSIASFQGPQGGTEDWGGGDGGCGVQVQHKSQDQAHMQQKMTMIRQRQLAIEKQRNAARSRLGASVVAQANPLINQAPKLESNSVKWGSLGIEAPALSTGTEKGKVNASAEGMSTTTGLKEASTGDAAKDPQTPQQRGGGKLNALDEIEELGDESMVSNNDRTDEEARMKALKKGRKERLAAQRAARDAVLGVDGSSPAGNAASRTASPVATADPSKEPAWGGGGGLVVQQAPPRLAAENCVEEFSCPGEMPQQAMHGPKTGGRIGRRGERSGRGSPGSGDESPHQRSAAPVPWSLDVDRAPEPPKEEEKKEKGSWWRRNGNDSSKKNKQPAGDVVEQCEVTQVVMMND